MAWMFFLLAMFLGSAAPASTAPADQAKQRDAQNWKSLFGKYPAGALARGEEGLVGIRVGLDRDGYATACEVTHTSGQKSLDEETCRLILNRAEFKGIEDAGRRKISSVHEGVVNWKLPTTPRDAVPAAPTRRSTADAPEKLICKRKLRTGSLADFERTCVTKSEWDRLRRETKDSWGELQGLKGSTRE